MVAGRVAARLTGRSSRPAATSTDHRSLARDLAAAYTLGWTILLLIAGACATIPAARWLAHDELALAMHIRIRPAPRPTLASAGWLLATNLRATGWPLLAALLQAQRHHGLALRRIVHVVVLTSLAANLLPIAAAIGVYRSQIIPYLPHLPMELYAIMTGPTTWWLSSRQALTRAQLALIAASIVGALLGAAMLEIWAVPHR